ncbi:glycosyltransferase [Paenibacillus paridis]|uniref:glycosyltransferase n=1 Tax=Paenibacillus paridis TaxID=2583376 RepID=UPI001121A666|nr:glycosyltransferase [Paenibacillus paridis]
MTSPSLSVLMALDSMDAGGTETHVLSLATALIRKGQRVSIVSADGLMRSRFEAAGCAVFLLDFARASRGEQALQIDILLQLMRNQRIDCVHVHQTPSGLLVANAAALLGIPTVFTAHGTYYPPGSLKTILGLSKEVISVSAPVQQYMERFGFASTVIPNGIDVQEFYPASGSQLRGELGIAEDAVVLVYASRLAWGKATACDTLLRAMKDLHRYGWHRLQLIVVGDGPKYQAIKELAAFIEEESGETFIHVIGQQAQMRECYNAADIVVGTGRVALEAMACEKPVLAIGNHGFFGWVEPSNYGEAWSHYFGDHGSYSAYSRYLFANEIAEGCRDLERLRAIGKDGRRWIEQEFHAERATEQAMLVYHSAIGHSR